MILNVLTGCIAHLVCVDRARIPNKNHNKCWWVCDVFDCYFALYSCMWIAHIKTTIRHSKRFARFFKLRHKFIYERMANCVKNQSVCERVNVRARVRSRNSHITRIDKLNVNWSSSRDYLSTFRLSANGFSTYVLFLNVRCHLLHCYPFLAHLLIFHESMLFLRFAVPCFFFLFI